jgi:hypothetical protein
VSVSVYVYVSVAPGSVATRHCEDSLNSDDHHMQPMEKASFLEAMQSVGKAAKARVQMRVG